MFSLSRRSITAASSSSLLLDFLAPSIAQTPRSSQSTLSTSCAASSSSSSASSSSAALGATSQPDRSTPQSSAQHPLLRQQRSTQQALEEGRQTKRSSSMPNKGNTARDKAHSHSSSPARSKSKRAQPHSRAGIPSALALLSEIRASMNTAPPLSPLPIVNEDSRRAESSSSASTPTSAPKPASQTLSHNDALQNMFDGITGTFRSYRIAFVRGWLPIRNARNAGQLQAKDLIKVLEAVSLESRKGVDSQAQWEQVKELVLWVHGSSNPIGVTQWAWREVQLGVEGAQRVIEVWDAILREEHLELRMGPKSLDHRSMDVPDLRSKSGSRPSGSLFTPYIVARSIVTPPNESFAALLPSLIGHHRTPSLMGYGRKAPREFENLFKVLANRALFPSAPSVIDRAQAWVRQVALAQLWYDRSDDPALGVVARVNAVARRNAQDEVWQLWRSVAEGVERDEVAWIDASEWDQNSRQRWITLRAKEQEQESKEEEEGEQQQSLAREETAVEESAVELESEEVGVDSTAPPRNSLSQAQLTPALVAPFITAFTRYRNFDQANLIWQWIPSRGLSHNVITWTALLHGYTELADVEASETVFKQMVDSGVKPDVWSWMERVAVHFAAREPHRAMDLFNTLAGDASILRELEGRQLPAPVWGQLIRGLLANRLEREAEDVVMRMEKAGAPFTIYHANNLLKFYISRRGKPDLDGVVRILRIVSEKGLEADVFTYTMVLQALLETGQSDAVNKLVRIMESSRIKPTTITYGSLIHHLASSGAPEKLAAAVDLIDEMERSNITTNEIIYTSVIQGFLRAIDRASMDANGAHPYFVTALHLKTRMEERRIPFNRIGYNAIIAAGLSLQSPWGVQLAMRTFREMQQARPSSARSTSSGFGVGNDVDREGNVVTPLDTWYVLLEGFARMGDWSTARALLREMEQSGLDVYKSKKIIRMANRIRNGGWGIE